MVHDYFLLKYLFIFNVQGHVTDNHEDNEDKRKFESEDT
jgi:hypothetical protein